MAIKWTILGGLIVAAMALYFAGGLPLAAAGLMRVFEKWFTARTAQAATRLDRAATLLGWIGRVLFGLGSAFAGVAFVVRWIEVDHVPLQNMFEVFLCLGMVMWPMSLFCRRLLGAGSEAFNAFLGFIILFPAAFIFKADPEHLPPALRSFLFVPHVAAYMLSYVIMAMAAFPAFRTLIAERAAPGAGEDLQPEILTLAAPVRSDLPPDIQAHRLVMLGFPLLTLGLALGSWWGKMAWGDYWNWDPKELWSLVSWLIYLGYFHFRYMFGRRYPRLLSLFILAGLAAIVITLLWVNLSHIFGGMHSYAS